MRASGETASKANEPFSAIRVRAFSVCVSTTTNRVVFAQGDDASTSFRPSGVSPPVVPSNATSGTPR